ncbi:MAG: RNase adapter RapZ [Actinobacteria bacterium]|nr:RNase adapter RapZ [Actinomycetota bacterium]
MTLAAGGPRFVILSGLSGAGKTQALDAFEDAGYFCIDNLPPQLVPTLVDLLHREGSKVEYVAVVCDARGGEYFGRLGAMLLELKERRVEYSLVFLEASEETLVRRFKETRRRHPLAPEGSVLDGIRAERSLLAGLRERADLIIDTGELSSQQLRSRLNERLIGERRRATIVFAFVSFGYKYGIPIDADLLFDVRFLPNPYWELDLRPLTGLDPAVRDFVLASEGFSGYTERLLPLLDYLFPRYAAEGKAHLTVGIGCTGGRHRSVSIAERLTQHYRRQGYATIVRHRDIARA